MPPPLSPARAQRAPREAWLGIFAFDQTDEFDPADAEPTLNSSSISPCPTDPDEIVTFSYCIGSGGGAYSSIPLDWYLIGNGPPVVGDNFRNIYAPNVVAYGAEGFCTITGSIAIDDVDIRQKPDEINHDRFQVRGSCTLGDGSDGMDPATEDVIVTDLELLVLVHHIDEPLVCLSGHDKAVGRR